MLTAAAVVSPLDSPLLEYKTEPVLVKDTALILLLSISWRFLNSFFYPEIHVHWNLAKSEG